MDVFKILRLLSDRGRVRILRLLREEDLSVAELQEILGMGQSAISMQLSQLRQAGLVETRRSGQRSIYRASNPSGVAELLTEVLEKSAPEIPEAADDEAGLALVLARRRDKLTTYFDEIAGRLGRDYLPGRSWKAFSEMLLRLLPPLVIADLGAGEGALSLLLAQRAKRVIAVDASVKMAEYAQGVASRTGVENFEYRIGEIERPPIDDESVDVALLHHSLHHVARPERAIREARRILRPGGRIVILDLLKHDFDAAREMYADVWLGFSQPELLRLLRAEEFDDPEVCVVFREEEPPYFKTVLAIGVKSGVFRDE
ncbi:MAG: metalloregulator ArsR/SmtB family transcription factor [Capsulimonadaceae bacterium]|nr:metalloregulator ArsR/SmtB family transcription factor [Capsulimonadaceae bacterium]